MKNSLPLLALLCICTSGVATAQFSGPATFSTAPWSQMGTVTNNLTITNTPTGFNVAGQVLVNVPSTVPPTSGILVAWVVDRPVINGYTGNNMFTTTVLDGYSLPQMGGGGNTSGYTSTIFTDYLGTTTSLSTVPMTLVNGFDNPQWNSLTDTSALFNYTAGTGQSLRQVFFLDGIYNGGPGGTWVIDVPVISFFTPVPEPTTWALLGTAMLCFAGYGLRRRRAKNLLV